MFDLRSSLSGSPRADVLSGITVALALVPEAVAFAFLAGGPPLVGLYAAFIMCLVTAVFGGRPGMISGATALLPRLTKAVPSSLAAILPVTGGGLGDQCQLA